MSDFNTLSRKLAADVYLEVMDSLGDDFESLTDEQQESIADTARRLLELKLRAETATLSELADLDAKIQAVESTVTDWKTWGVIGVEDAFWKGVKKVAQTFGSFLGGVARGII